MSTPEATFLHPDVITIDGFLSPAECKDLIARSEAESYEEATIMTAAGGVMAKGVRNNDRVISDDSDMATRLWKRLKGLLPSPYRNRFVPVGMNERFRFYRYGPGQKFEWHQDGSFSREDRDERSLFTFMVYLNEECEGGETMFRQLPPHDGPHEFAVKPRTGTALLFLQPLWHTGAEVRGGVKYVLRSDIMYVRTAPA